MNGLVPLLVVLVKQTLQTDRNCRLEWFLCSQEVCRPDQLVQLLEQNVENWGVVVADSDEGRDRSILYQAGGDDGDGVLPPCWVLAVQILAEKVLNA